MTSMLQLMSHTGGFMDILRLYKGINSNYFDYQKLSNVLSKSSHIRRDISKLIKEGHIVRIKKGLYIWGEDLRRRPYSKEILANLIYGPSYISLEYALAFYGLIPERVDVVTSITTQRKKSFETPIGGFDYAYLWPEAYPWGVVKKTNEQAESFLIATPEKALLDYICIRIKKISEQEFDYQKLLYDDLRIEEEEFAKMDIEKLYKLSSYYKNVAVKKLAKSIYTSEKLNG